MVVDVALSERRIRPIILSGIECQLPLCLLSHLFSIRQLGRKRQLPTETNGLDPRPQLLIVADAAAVKSRMSSFMHDGCGNQFKA